MGTEPTRPVRTTPAKPISLRTLREVREEAGVSIRDLEARSGVSRFILSNIERGRMAGTREELDAIAAALGMAAGAIEMRLLAVVPEERA